MMAVKQNKALLEAKRKLETWVKNQPESWSTPTGILTRAEYLERKAIAEQYTSFAVRGWVIDHLGDDDEMLDVLIEAHPDVDRKGFLELLAGEWTKADNRPTPDTMQIRERSRRHI